MSWLLLILSIIKYDRLMTDRQKWRKHEEYYCSVQKSMLNFAEHETGMVSIVLSKSKEKSRSRGINSGLMYYSSLNIVILSNAWTKLAVTLEGPVNLPYVLLPSHSVANVRRPSW